MKNTLMIMPILAGCYFNCAFNQTHFGESNLKNEGMGCEIESTHDILFSFGDETLCDDTLSFYVSLDDVADVEIGDTNSFDLEMTSCEDKTYWFSAYLPMADAEAELTFVFEDSTKNYSLYSTYSEQKGYALSTISSYSAKKLLGTLPNQELMDGGDDASVFEETIDDENVVKARVSGTSAVTVYGYLYWQDDNGQDYPAVGLQVKGKLSNYYYAESSTFTNSSGKFTLTFTGPLGSNPTCELHFYTENDFMTVTDHAGTPYEKVVTSKTLTIGQNNSFGIYSFTISKDSDLAKAVQVFQAGYNYASYAQTLCNDKTIEKCTIVYPGATDDYASRYFNGLNTIHMAHESYKKEGYPEIYASWDVIGHEYGHHIQHQFFFQEYFGTHYVNYNDIYNYFYLKQIEANEVGTAYNIDSSEIENAKKQGLGLALKEAWPTFFAISAQKTFDSHLKALVATVGDSIYTSYNGVVQDLKATTNTYGIRKGSFGGESDEHIIMSFLYRLWDSDNSIEGDTFTIDDGDLFDFMRVNNPANLSEFVTQLNTSDFVTSKENLGSLLGTFGISSIGVSASDCTDEMPPTFEWSRGGVDVIFNNTTYEFGNNLFSLNFYNSERKLITYTRQTTSNSYTIDKTQWNEILLAKGDVYYVSVVSYATVGTRTGPYYSGYYKFNKPN